MQTSEYLNQTYYLLSKQSSHLRRFREIKTIFAFVAVEYYAQSKISSSLVLSDNLMCLLFFGGLWSLLKCHICPSVDAEVSVPAHPHRYLLQDLPPGVTNILMRAVTDAGVGPDGPRCNVNITEGIYLSIYLSICLSSTIYVSWKRVHLEWLTFLWSVKYKSTLCFSDKFCIVFSFTETLSPSSQP